MIFPNFRSLDPGRDDDPKHKVTEYIGHEKQYIRNCDMHVWDQVRSYSPALSFRLLPSPTVQLIQLSRFQQWSLWNPSNKNLPHQHWNKPNLSETSEMTWRLPWIAVSWKISQRFTLEVSDHHFPSRSQTNILPKRSGQKDQGNFVSFGWIFQGIYILCGETSNILYVHLGIYDPLWRASYSHGLVQPPPRKDPLNWRDVSFFSLSFCGVMTQRFWNRFWVYQSNYFDQREPKLNLGP